MGGSHTIINPRMLLLLINNHPHNIIILYEIINPFFSFFPFFICTCLPTRPRMLHNFYHFFYFLLSFLALISTREFTEKRKRTIIHISFRCFPFSPPFHHHILLWMPTYDTLKRIIYLYKVRGSNASEPPKHQW